MGNLFAFIATMLNATIGILSRFSFNAEFDHISLAFFRCFLAFVFISIYFILKKGGINEIKTCHKYKGKIALTSFFGIFVLYYFEMWALKITTIPVVSFLLYASGIVGIIIGVLWLKESLSIYKIMTIVFIFSGIFLIFYNIIDGNLNFLGGILAIIAGSGYSMFLVFTRKFKIPGILSSLWWLFGFGSIYLLIPLIINGISIPEFKLYPYIISLAIVPTIGGFYFTNKALDLTEATKVQLIQMSEPIFASVFAFAIFHEALSRIGYLGGILVLLGLIILQLDSSLKKINFIQLLKNKIGN